MAKGGSNERTQESTSTFNLPSWYQPHVQGLMSMGLNAYGATNRSPYEGDFYAGLGTGSRDALNRGTQAALGSVNNYKPVLDEANKTLSGYYLDVNNNPYFQGYANAATRPVYDQLLDPGGTIDQITSRSIAEGAYGGSAVEAAKAQAATRAARDAGDIRAGIAGNVYGAERGFMQAAPGMIGQAMQLQQDPYQQMLRYGGIEQADRQGYLDQDYRHFQDALQAPWRGLSEYASILGSVPVGGTQTSRNIISGEEAGGKAGGIQGGLGGAAGLGALGVALAPTGGGSLVPLLLAGAGAGLGGYAGSQG